MEQTARPQIFRYVTRDKVLDVGDLLDADPKRSKVRFILLQFGRDFKATTRALHYVDADDLEVVCWDILHGTFREWVDHKGSVRDGTCQARVLTLRKDPKYENPYVLQIRNGPGQVIGQGAVKLVRAEVSLSLLLPEFDARRLSLVVLDYVRAWKQAHFADLAKARVGVAAGEKAGEHGQNFRPVGVSIGNGPARVATSGSGIVPGMAGRTAVTPRIASAT